MGIFDLLYHYGLAAVGKLWLVLTGAAPLVIDQLLLSYWPRWQDWFKKRGPWRRRVEVAFLIGAIIWAGFAAWSDEYGARMASDRLAQQRLGEIQGADGKGGLKAQIAALQAQVKTMNQQLPTARQTAPAHVAAQTPVHGVVTQQAAAESNRDPNKLYQNGDVVADVNGAHAIENGKIEFDILSDTDNFDQAKPVTYQRWMIQCVPQQRFSMFAGTEYGPLRSTIHNELCDKIGAANP